MSHSFDGNAIVYCEGAFTTPNGKTAHGLVRHTDRYRVINVVDSVHAGNDAGQLLDRRPNDIPVVDSIATAITDAKKANKPATHLVIGLAPDGGRLSLFARDDVKVAIRSGLHVDSGLHDLLSEDTEIAELAREFGVQLRDVRKPPPLSQLHFFSGKIEDVTSFKVAVLGTDSAIGKRTTAVLLVKALREQGLTAELIGTGQTSWMQGVRYGIVLDSLINDFVAGEIEHAVWSAWSEQKPDVIILEGQGSLLNPAYPGGFELLAAGRPDAVVMQHAPARDVYDGFPNHPMHPLERQIQAIEVVSDRPVVAVTLNHELLDQDAIEQSKRDVAGETGLPVFDVLLEGAAGLAEVIAQRIASRECVARESVNR